MKETLKIKDKQQTILLDYKKYKRGGLDGF